MFKKQKKITKKRKKAVWRNLFVIFKNKKNKKSKLIKNNLKDFIKEEKREVQELVSGKQSFFRYWRDASFLFKEYFIPGDYNNNKPKILRPKQLTIVVALLVFLKIFLVSYIFIIYQKEASMSESIVNQVFFLTNEERLSNNIDRLSLDSGLTEAAYAKANDMIVNDYFSHTSLDGRRPWNFVSRNKYAYILIGENLAMNFISASGAHTALMASPSHQKNILNPKYTDIGLAVVNGEIDGKNTNILVQIFGAKTTSSEDQDSQDKNISEDVSPDSVSSEEGEVKVEAEEKNISQIEEDKIIPEEPIKDINTDIITEEDSSQNNQNDIELENIETEYQSQENSRKERYSLITSGTLSEAQVEDFSEDLNPHVENNLPIMPYVSAWDDFSQVDPIPEDDISVSLASSEQVNKGYRFIQVSRIIYAIFLIILILALIINIVFRIAVQHKSVIIQILLLIVLIIGLLLLDFGFINEIKEAAKNIIVL